MILGQNLPLRPLNESQRLTLEDLDIRHTREETARWTRTALIIDDNKETLSTTMDFSRVFNARSAGFQGEAAVLKSAGYTDINFPIFGRYQGDEGQDIVASDIKTTVDYWHNAYLKEFPSDHSYWNVKYKKGILPADYYIAVSLNYQMRRAKILGWCTSVHLFNNSNIRNFGNPKASKDLRRHSIHFSQLLPMSEFPIRIEQVVRNENEDVV